LHDRKLKDYSNIELSALMSVYRDRTCSYISREKIRYVSLFKNSGKASGASIDHPHSQLIALPFYPPSFEKEIKIIKERETCPYCEIFERERVSPRLIFENSECIAFAPYFSMGPYEVWVLPRRHVNFLGDCSEKLLFSLGEILRSVLKSFGKIFEDMPFNYMFYQVFETSKYHLNLRLLPRVSITGGFELNTGVYINTVSPERAASYLRGDFMPQK
jgi:UDPglucose--hexose-1-phosphate uridylyltransferase